jgi:fatty-acyl-CoA synthase
MTLSARLETAATGRGSITFVGAAAGSGTAERVEWSQLHDEARAMAVVLARHGVGPGTHVGVLGSTSRPLVTSLQAVWLAGATVVALPLPMRLGSIEEFVAQTRRRIEGADRASRSSPSTCSPVARTAPGRRHSSARRTIPTGSRSCSSRAARPPSPKG